MSDDNVNSRVTAIDVARAAGVSRALVSRTFTKGASVSPKKREMVLETARKLGYEPNVAARILAGKASNVVGILIGPILNPFIAGLLDSLTDRLREFGYLPTLFKIGTDGDLRSILPSISKYHMLSTIIVGVGPSAEISRPFAAKAQSLIILNLGVIRDVDATVITTDHVGGGMMAVQALIEGGGRRPAIVSGALSRTVYREREAGFRHVLDEAGIAWHGREVADGSYEGGLSATLDLMAGDEPPDAIFYGNDVMALGGLDALRLELGLNVPDDVAVVGYDDIPNASLGSYSLSTIRQPTDALVAKAVQAVTAYDAGGTVDSAATLVSPTFIARTTTRARPTP